MKIFLLSSLISLVAIVCADVARPEPAPVDLPRRHDRLIDRAPGSAVEKGAIISSLIKKDAFNDYQDSHTLNRIPDFIVCNSHTGEFSVMYTEEDIWQALQNGLRYLRSGTFAVAGGGRVYPHAFMGYDEQLQNVDIGSGDQNNMFEFPIVSTAHPIYQGPFNGGGLSAGPDRIVFDNNGVYMGIITHRGERLNTFHWCIPTDVHANSIGANPRQFPGIGIIYHMPLGGFQKFF